MSLGPRGESAVRSLIRDVSVPGLFAGEQLRSWRSKLDLARWPWSCGRSLTASTDSNHSQDAAILAELRRLRFELAAERDKLASFQASLGPIRWPTQTAHAVKRITARVLLPEGGFSRAGGIVLSAGAAVGVDADRIVVDRAVLDAGGERLPHRATVLAGATVVGKTADVGAWTTTLLPVNDPAFRAHVRLVREGNAGTVLGEQGVLEGDGSGGCLVKYIPSTAAVEVGDHVYSFDPTGRIPQPLYYGQVDRAELRPEAPHWEIQVRPAMDLAPLSEVQVLVEESPVAELAEGRN